MLAIASVRGDIANYVSALFGVYIALLFIYLIVNIVFAFGARPPYARWSEAVLTFLREISEPYLRIFRRFLPQFGMFDLSPILALIVLYILDAVITNLIRG